MGHSSDVPFFVADLRAVAGPGPITVVVARAVGSPRRAVPFFPGSSPLPQSGCPDTTPKEVGSVTRGGRGLGRWAPRPGCGSEDACVGRPPGARRLSFPHVSRSSSEMGIPAEAGGSRYFTLSPMRTGRRPRVSSTRPLRQCRRVPVGACAWRERRSYEAEVFPRRRREGSDVAKRKWHPPTSADGSPTVPPATPSAHFLQGRPRFAGDRMPFVLRRNSLTLRSMARSSSSAVRQRSYASATSRAAARIG